MTVWPWVCVWHRADDDPCKTGGSISWNPGYGLVPTLGSEPCWQQLVPTRALQRGATADGSVGGDPTPSQVATREVTLGIVIVAIGSDAVRSTAAERVHVGFFLFLSLFVVCYNVVGGGGVTLGIVIVAIDSDAVRSNDPYASSPLVRIPVIPLDVALTPPPTTMSTSG
jgi:hypothetical protein